MLGRYAWVSRVLVKKPQGEFQLSSRGKQVYAPIPPSNPWGMQLVTAMNEFEYSSKTLSLLYASTCCRPELQHGVSTMPRPTSSVIRYSASNSSELWNTFFLTKGTRWKHWEWPCRLNIMWCILWTRLPHFIVCEALWPHFLNACEAEMKSIKENTA